MKTFRSNLLFRNKVGNISLAWEESDVERLNQPSFFVFGHNQTRVNASVSPEFDQYHTLCMGRLMAVVIMLSFCAITLVAALRGHLHRKMAQGKLSSCPVLDDQMWASCSCYYQKCKRWIFNRSSHLALRHLQKRQRNRTRPKWKSKRNSKKERSYRCRFQSECTYYSVVKDRQRETLSSRSMQAHMRGSELVLLFFLHVQLIFCPESICIHTIES